MGQGPKLLRYVPPYLETRSNRHTNNAITAPNAIVQLIRGTQGQIQLWFGISLPLPIYFGFP